MTIENFIQRKILNIWFIWFSPLKRIDQGLFIQYLDTVDKLFMISCIHSIQQGLIFNRRLVSAFVRLYHIWEMHRLLTHIVNLVQSSGSQKRLKESDIIKVLEEKFSSVFRVHQNQHIKHWMIPFLVSDMSKPYSD